MSSFTFTEVVRLAQIGVSGPGRVLLQTLSALPSAELIVLCDTDDDALAAAGRLCPSVRTTARAETVLADPAVDAIAIGAGATSWETARACLESGKHVLISPPFAPSLDEARTLTSLADANEVRLMVGHGLRYHPAVQFLQGRIADGDFGTVRTLSWHLGGLQAASPASILDRTGPSALSVTQAILDDAPRSVTATGQRYTPDGGEDVILLTVAYRSGGLAHVHMSRIEARETRQLTVVGSKGLAAVDALHPTEPLRMYRRDLDTTSSTALDFAHTGHVRAGDIQIPRLPVADPLSLQCREFVAAIRERRSPLTDGGDGVAVTRLLDAARQSLDAGGTPVDVA